MPEGFVGGFEDEGYVVEAWVLHHESEAVYAQNAFAEAVVAVYSRAESFLGVVEVHASQIVKSYNVVEFLPCALVAFDGSEVVACCIGMAGVYAYSYAAFVLYAVYDGGEVGKVVAYV